MNNSNAFNSQFLSSSAKPCFEIWFAVIIDKITKKALWIRYTTFFPHPSFQQKAVAVMWASWFDRENPNNHCYGAETYPIDQVNLDKEPYIYPNGKLSSNNLLGKLMTAKGLLEWNLSFEHQFEAFDHTPSWLSRSNIPKTKSLVCSPFAKVQGTVMFNNNTYAFNKADGWFNHICGTQRVESLFWTYVPCFDDDSEGWSLEIASVKAKNFLPTLTFTTLARKEHLYHQTSLWNSLNGTLKVNFPNLEFKSKVADYQIEVKSQLDKNQITPYIYRDPNGAKLHILQSDVGQASCVIKANNYKKMLISKDGAAVEFHSIKPWREFSYLDPYFVS